MNLAPRRARPLRTLRGRVAVCFAAVVVAFAAIAAVAIATVRVEDAATAELSAHLRPAQADVATLTQHLLDREAGIRELALTGRSSLLQPYATGMAAETSLLRDLRAELAVSRPASTTLRRASTAITSWNSRVAAPIIAAYGVAVRPDRPLPLSDQQAGTGLFDAARARLTELDHDVTTAIAEASAKSAAAGDHLAWIVWVVLTLLVLLSVGLFALLRQQITKPLELLGQRVAAAGSGNLEEPIPMVGAAELATLATAVDQMRLRLLEQASDTLHRSLIIAHDEERRLIAQNVHDDSVQALTVVSLNLQRLSRRLRDPEQEAIVREAEIATANAIARLRRLMFELHPVSLEREGLAAALRRYFVETLDPTDVQWNVAATLKREPSRPVQSLAYRLAREAVLNAIKHAQPTRVGVAIVERNHGVAAVITDDGRGFNPDAIVPAPGHMGLSTTTAMATAAGGWWRVLSRPRHGTTVEFWLPDRSSAGATRSTAPGAGT